MKALSLLIIVSFSSFASAADGSSIVKFFTLKDGATVIAVEALITSADGNTSYAITQPDGKKMSFDGSQVSKVEEGPLADFANRAAQDSPDTPVIATRKPEPAQARTETPAKAATPSVDPYAGPGLGTQPSDERDRRKSLFGFGAIPYSSEMLMVDKTGVSRFNPDDGTKTPVTQNSDSCLGFRGLTGKITNSVNQSNATQSANVTAAQAGSTVIGPKDSGIAQHWNISTCMQCHTQGVPTPKPGPPPYYFNKAISTTPATPTGSSLTQSIVVVPSALGGDGQRGATVGQDASGAVGNRSSANTAKTAPAANSLRKTNP